MSKPVKFPDPPAFSDKLFRLYIHNCGCWHASASGPTIASLTKDIGWYLSDKHWFVTRLDESIVLASDESIPQEQSK